MSRKRSAMTPAQLAADGMAEYAPGRWRKAQPVATVKQSLTVEPAKANPRDQWAGCRNKSEYLYRCLLERQYHGCQIRYENIRIALPAVDGKISYYTIDFAVWDSDRLVCLHEYKGNHRFARQGIDRLRAAVAMHPEWVFYLGQTVKGEFRQQLMSKEEG